MSTFDVKTVAGEAVPILDVLEKFAPYLSGLLAMTPAAVAAPWVVGFFAAADEGAKALASGNNMEAVDVLGGLAKQMIPGMTNMIAGSPAQQKAVANSGLEPQALTPTVS